MIPTSPWEPAASTWLEEPGRSRRRWIFKPVRARSHPKPGEGPVFEEDWAEYVATRVGETLGVPMAPVRLATRQGWRGVVSPSFVVDPSRPPTFGNELLAAENPEYERGARGEVDGYTVTNCLRVLDGRLAPEGAAPPLSSAVDAFASYLVLDGLVANNDRHHENWAVLPGTARSRLAPCYDLGTCLGFNLTDRERQERLTTADGNRTVEAYAERGVSRPFQGRPRVADLAASAVRAASPAVQAFLRTRVEALDRVTLDALVDEVPPEILSQPARTFAVRLITINRRRLLEAMP